MIKLHNQLLLVLLILLLALPATSSAQNYLSDTNRDEFLTDDNFNQNGKPNIADSLGTDREIPKGIKVWTIDERFGDRRPAMPDTLSHMYPNSIFTTGMRGEYITTGNLGAPRLNRIFIDRNPDEQFIFTSPYDYVLSPIGDFHFTNTLSPFTNLSYNNAGNRTNGEDHLVAKFAVNAGKRLGVGFNVDYSYGRGYYSNQSTSHFKYLMYGSYLGDRYQAHLIMSTINQKVSENGGIIDDEYIMHPESFDDNFSTSEIPTVLNHNWNRNDNQHIYLNHRYSIGFKRKVRMTDDEIAARKFAMESERENQKQRDMDAARKKAEQEGRDFDERRFNNKTYSGRPDDARVVDSEPMPADTISKLADRIVVDGETAIDSINSINDMQDVAAQDTMWLKTEYVPVTSFIHTLRFDTYRRIYQAYDTPENFYAQTFDGVGPCGGDSIFDKTKHLRLQNTFAISLLEGFNKWAKAGLKAFITSDLRHFTLPDRMGYYTSYNEHNLIVGAQLSKREGRSLHFDATAETCLVGADLGMFKVDAGADVNFALFGDTVRLAASGFFHSTNPGFYYRHYHSRHYWWDNDDMAKTLHSRLQGVFSYEKTKTRLRVAFDNIKNYAYFAMSYAYGEERARTASALMSKQESGAVSLLTLELQQDVRLGPLHWENVITYQKSSDNDILPMPELNIYTNLYLRFKIARVLKCDFGADARYFTSYYAPEYNPGIGQYCVQSGDSRVKVGNYPLVNVYANFHLKRTRFFVMMSHINAGQGNRAYFYTPHYPLNERVFRMGVSWNFYN